MISMRARQMQREVRAARHRPMTDSEYRVHRAKDSNDRAPAEGIAAAIMMAFALYLLGAIVVAHLVKP